MILTISVVPKQIGSISLLAEQTQKYFWYIEAKKMKNTLLHGMVSCVAIVPIY